MKSDKYTKFVLTLIAIGLFINAGISWRVNIIEDAGAQTTIDDIKQKALRNPESLTRQEYDLLLATDSTTVWVNGGEVQIDNRSIEKLAEALGDEIR